MDEATRNAWCRENGVYPKDLAAWRDGATQALAGRLEARVTPMQTRDDHRRIKEIERELRRKEKALAASAALLVLSKKVEASTYAPYSAGRPATGSRAVTRARAHRVAQTLGAEERREVLSIANFAALPSLGILRCL